MLVSNTSPWKNHAFLPSTSQHQFVAQVEIGEVEVGKLPEQFVMIAGQVVYGDLLCNEFDKLLDHEHVITGPVSFAELPYINDIPIEDENTRLYAFEVFDQFVRLAAVCAEVYIGDHHYVYFSLFHGAELSPGSRVGEPAGSKICSVLVAVL